MPAHERRLGDLAESDRTRRDTRGATYSAVRNDIARIPPPLGVSSSRSNPKNLSRRTITRASAWAVPAIAIVATAPNAAASGEQPVLDYDFAGISATGEPGTTLSAGTEDGPGARIRDKATGAPIEGQTVLFEYISGSFTLNIGSALSDATGAARGSVTFNTDAPRGVLGAIRATWVGLDGNTYSAVVDVSVND
ncbi:hypothetical protein HQQ81_21190 [Microbacteriaceae bacterium VKM Ac-2854]|nr:hypothetical protein [Microbacteriaceae bacterium VKM Ac-2854]